MMNRRDYDESAVTELSPAEFDLDEDESPTLIDGITAWMALNDREAVHSKTLETTPAPPWLQEVPGTFLEEMAANLPSSVQGKSKASEGWIYKTYGVLPSREEFDHQWHECFGGNINHLTGDGTPDLFAFGNDPRLGTVNLSQEEVWGEIVVAHAEFVNTRVWETDSDVDTVGDWVSNVLYSLRIEWV